MAFDLWGARWRSLACFGGGWANGADWSNGGFAKAQRLRGIGIMAFDLGCGSLALACLLWWVVGLIRLIGLIGVGLFGKWGLFG